jgi:2-polyprenyl-6-methoxyphenol hydroxylase-like FAD-dependent oxidoreductase
MTDAHPSRQNGHVTEPKHVVIVGGSLAGLFAGVALKTLGTNTTILERNPNKLLDNQGAGIVAGGDTMAFFEKYNRCPRDVAIQSQKRLYLDPKGNIVHEEVMKQTMTSWDLVYYLLRANYDNVESDYLQGKKPSSWAKDTDGTVDYRYGCTVTGYAVKDGRVEVAYARGDEQETVTSDLLIGADGPSSTIRKILYPDVHRDYCGYVVIRGTVPENEASPESKAAFIERFTFYHGPGVQNLTYTIPGINGATEKGKRLLNFVWYTNFPEGNDELEKLMTDKDGKRRRITIPPGMMTEEAWEMVKVRGRNKLPPQMAEMVQKSRNPFVQAITDVIAPTSVHENGKVILIGDALAGFRPHTVSSTSQAAFDVLMLVEVLEGRMDMAEFERRTVEYARKVSEMGKFIGDRSQYEERSLKEYVEDRNMMSTPRNKLKFPPWTQVR